MNKKSEIFILAHREAKKEMASGNFDSYREAFADCLKVVYWNYGKTMKLEEKKESISSVKESFWAGWKMVKNARYSKVPGSLRMAEDVFYGACDKLRAFGEEAVKEAFGKYADFAISKAF